MCANSKAMCGQIKNETTAIHRIQRAMLNRVDDEKTRNKALVPNYAGIRSGKALSVDFQFPLAFSSLLREDYILTPRAPS
jgi:hypothetical protein